jgi:phosphoserine phosphatase RsbU/P
MVTAFQVGGDVYDFYFNDDRRLAFVVADASGKGLPAAIFITRMRTILRAASRRIGDPAQCLTLLNEVLCFDNPDLMFVTAFYGILDTAMGEVVFANAGPNPPVRILPRWRRRFSAKWTVSPAPRRSPMTLCCWCCVGTV